jgi:L-glyceraldehyde 3-phosphate reductase
MFDRWVEKGLLDVIGEKGVGSIAFSPLEQGVLTDKYLKGIPEDSRIAKDGRYLKESQISDAVLSKVSALNKIALNRGQSLAQMAIAWLLKDERITTVLVGVSKPEQLADNVNAVKNLNFTESELKEIEEILV